MNKTIIITAIALTLAGCTTPKTMLKHEKTGQIVTCGGTATGSMVGGVIGHEIQKSNDADCVKAHQAQGFTIISTTQP